MKTYKKFLQENTTAPLWQHLVVTKTKRKKLSSSDDGDIYQTSYAIHKQGKAVGKLVHNEYFGGTTGELYGKKLPEIGPDKYSTTSGYDPQNIIKNFLKSKTGQRWASNLKF